MKIASLFLTAALLVPTAATFAQSLSATATASGAPAAAPAASVTYFGTVPSNDAAHEQFARMRQAFAQCQPTVVFFENPDLGTDSTEAATIGRMGPAGYARFLAQQQHVATQRLDDVYAEYAYLQTKLAPEPLKLYWLLRQTQQFRQATGAPKDLVLRATKAFITNGAHDLPGSEQVVRTPAELRTAYRTYCPTGGAWWSLPATAFGAQPTGAPDFVLNATRAVNEYRAARLATQVAAAVQAGQRVLVVLDRAHLPAPAQPAYAAQPRVGR
ncbi:hypothetical protein [Hymenobacter sp. PAMC 26628]|uniref:hypothetical protein n=1 Tax=Hymenobacter sp. PAMC 26628 TaxID=1484118 RepID=UPI000770399B|nr:hypothetical protein [Hymenobacter sp. PAMC 26628]AMJ65371.1 hypothetical protein AXW84_07950 [Hymenobacter sp. PAMC 26628]